MSKGGSDKQAVKLVRAIYASLTLNDKGAEKLLRSFVVHAMNRSCDMIFEALRAGARCQALKNVALIVVCMHGIAGLAGERCEGDKGVCWPTKGSDDGKRVCWLTKGYVGRQKGFMTSSPFQLLRPKSGPQAMSATLELALKCELPNP